MTQNAASPASFDSDDSQTSLPIVIQKEPTHSSAVTFALKRAYLFLSSPARDETPFLMAQACLRPMLDISMSQTQRMHVFYALSISLDGVGNSEQALGYADEAVDLAQDRRDEPALITLLHFRGGLARSVGALYRAAQDYTECIALIRTSQAGLRFRNTSLELDLVSRLAGFELYLARFERARERLGEAHSMTDAQRESPVARATLQWTQALVDRWSGRPTQALQQSVNALVVYSGGDYPLSESRLRVAITDITLDLAKRLPPGTARDKMIDFAGKQLEAALDLSTNHEDITGQCLIELARIRRSRLAGFEENRAACIERVQQTSQQLSDNTLLAQCYTSSAEECVEQHNLVSAQEAYRQAIYLAEASDAPALGVWARQGLIESERQGNHD